MLRFRLLFSKVSSAVLQISEFVHLLVADECAADEFGVGNSDLGKMRVERKVAV